MTINWDLASSHTITDVGFDRDEDVDHWQIEPVERVRIVLPGGTVFEADDVHDLRLDRTGDVVNEINVVLEERSAEEAHERATEINDSLEIGGGNLDEWLADALEARAEGDESGAGPATSALTSQNSEGPFFPSVEIQYSFDGDKPWLVFFTMFWDSEGQ